MPPAASAPVFDVDEHLEHEDGIQLRLKGSTARRIGDALLGLSAAVAQYVFAGLFLAIALKPSIYDTNPALGARMAGLPVPARDRRGGDRRKAHA